LVPRAGTSLPTSSAPPRVYHVISDDDEDVSKEKDAAISLTSLSMLQYHDVDSGSDEELPDPTDFEAFISYEPKSQKPKTIGLQASASGASHTLTLSSYTTRRSANQSTSSVSATCYASSNVKFSRKKAVKYEHLDDSDLHIVMNA
jgi:hypothetical protein